jgi:SAM-dependent methyltransferase
VSRVNRTRSRDDLAAPSASASEHTSSATNERLWQAKRGPDTYAHRTLRPAEVMMLVRHREALSGRVLEIGCGGGRILGYLLALGGEVHGIDISAAMVDYCRAVYPAAHVRLGNLRRLEDAVDGRFDAVVAADNVLDVLADDERRQVLATIRELVSPDGLLLFSSHNLAADALGSGAASAGRVRRLTARLIHTTPAGALISLLRLPRRWVNRRRLAPLERRAADYAVLNDCEGDYGALHYYMDRDHQQRQLEAIGFELVECLGVDGIPVGSGGNGASSWLYYVARPAQTTGLAHAEEARSER